MLVIRRRRKPLGARCPASVTLRPSRARYGRLRHLDDDHDDELRATSYDERGGELLSAIGSHHYVLR